MLQKLAVDTRFKNILDAHFGNDGKTPYLCGVDIAGNVPHALVPNVCIHIPPAVLFQDRMYRSPSDLRIPKP